MEILHLRCVRVTLDFQYILLLQGYVPFSVQKSHGVNQFYIQISLGRASLRLHFPMAESFQTLCKCWQRVISRQFQADLWWARHSLVSRLFIAHGKECGETHIGTWHKWQCTMNIIISQSTLFTVGREINPSQPQLSLSHSLELQEC